jgi:hypothetical protein
LSRNGRKHHRPSREGRGEAQERADLKREIHKLKREVARLRKQIEQLEEPETAAVVEDKPTKRGKEPHCPHCDSIDLTEMKLPSGSVLVICRSCRATMKK